MSETLQRKAEFEQKIPRECEQKLLPLFPEKLSVFRSEAVPIEQLYLSHPSESYSLRLRETFEAGALTYTATLKDGGQLTAEGLDRLEVETPISAELYRYYKQLYAERDELVVLRKLRAEPTPDVIIDFYDDGHVQIESEHPASLRLFQERHGLQNDLTDLSGDHFVNNEWRAHIDFRRRHAGREALQPGPMLDTDEIVHQILQSLPETVQTIVSLCGRSGSGKSTIVREIQEKLRCSGVTSETISTDDYHRGASWLTNYNNGAAWQNWDDPIVYDTDAMSRDLTRLANGESIPRRRIDFGIVEQVTDGTILPAPVIIVEGIRAGSPEIAQHVDKHYEIPTPLATCIGRRLLRDLSERPQFADPAASLQYMLEFAEPAWQTSAQ